MVVQESMIFPGSLSAFASLPGRPREAVVEDRGVVQNRPFLGDTQTRGSSRSCGPDPGRQGCYAGGGGRPPTFKPAGSEVVRDRAR